MQAALARFTEFDQATRYPWVKQNLGNGFTSADMPLICEILIRLRTDIPITKDDYPLGMFLRGHHHNHPEHPVNAHLAALQGPPIAAARAVIPNVDQMIRR